MRRDARRQASRSWRLFVAVYPPLELAQILLRAARGVAPTDARFTPPDQVHLTVQFVGDADERQLQHVRESVSRAVAGLGPFTLTPRGMRLLPERGPARLLAVETDAPPTLLEVKRRLVARLARSTRAESGEAFVPHLTLARFNPPRPMAARDEHIAASPFGVHEVKLMRSMLRPTGAAHVEVMTVELGASASSVQ